MRLKIFHRTARRTGLHLLTAAFGLTLLALLPLHWPTAHLTYTHLAVVDITQSMNVEDMALAGQTVSRLEYVKANLRHALTALPCGSRLGVAVFTGRRPFLLFEPIEVCTGFAALDAALAQLDWRMAWEADSRIADSLRNALQAFGTTANLVFITDGQEAPPLNNRYRPDLHEFQTKTNGIILGVGGLTPAPIPKFSADGKREGFFQADEVLQRSTFGLPELAPDQVENYNARNNPFGNPQTGGSEHLSALREDYLRQLSADSGLLYRRADSPAAFQAALLEPRLAKPHTLATDLRWLPASLALLALLLAYALPGQRDFNP